MGGWVGGWEGTDLLDGVVLVHAGDDAVLAELLRHGEGAHRVHVGGHDGYARPGPLGMLEDKFPVQVHLYEEE